MDEAEARRAKYRDLHEDADSRAVRGGNGNYCFNLNTMERHRFGPHYGNGRCSVIKGEKIQIVLNHKPQGTGSRLHIHPNEQFNYVIKGHLDYCVAGVKGVAGPGELVYIPANTEHYTRATVDGDALFLATKDTSYYSSGDPIDTSEFGPYYAPGFEPKE